MVYLFSERVIRTEAGEVVELEDLLIFFSGARQEPPVGFGQKPTLVFLADESNMATASTCTLILRIPIHSDYLTFKHYFTLSLKGHNGFGIV